MVQLRTHRTALALYALLLFLPTIVLGWLQWHQITSEYDAELQSLPRDADDAARRLRDELRDRLNRLLRTEDARAFHQYGANYCPDETCASGVLFVTSPLVRERRPSGVLGWFAFDVPEGPLAPFQTFYGEPEGSEENQKSRASLDAATKRFVQRTYDEGSLKRATRMDDYRDIFVPLGLVAAHRLQDTDPECLHQNEDRFKDSNVALIISPFHLQFYLENGEPHVLATRRVLMNPMPALGATDPCLKGLAMGFGLVQGFYIDPAWLFDELPKSLAARVLGLSQRFVPAGAADCCEGRIEYHAEVHPVTDLGFETSDDAEKNFGLMRIAVDTAATHDRFRSQELRFALLAVMLLVSLGTGLALLLRSVSRELDQAARTENFVAAVTHELRTPLSSIKLHGEMLLDGWAKDEAKQREYHRRIVRETERLSTLVERVLEKSRLTAGKTKAAPGDLNRAVRALETPLANARDGERADTEMKLDDSIPWVFMTAEAVSSMVINLVENARKYAPVDWSKPGAEPIEIATRREGSRVVLEVLDRGPGVPESERERIFEAFYRVGDEKTRTTRGTGLGLHLVALHAAALGGEASVLPRPGGGSIFRITFVPTADRQD